MTGLQTLGADIGDLDGDGDLDIFVANYDSTGSGGNKNKIYKNDGSGGFTVEAVKIKSDSGYVEDTSQRKSTSVALGDLDGDGDLDAFVTGEGENNRIFLNQSTSSAIQFSCRLHY